MPEFPPLIQSTPEIPDTFERIVRKDIRSANWDGGGSLEGGKDTAATTGYLIDYGTGAAQFQAIYAEGGSIGDLTIDDELTVQDYLTLGAGGVFRTAASGQRIEMTNTDKNYIYFYSGDADEEQAGYIQEATSGAGVTRTIQFGMKTPAIDPDDQTAAIVVRSGSPDGTTYAPGIVVAKSTPLGLGTGMDPQFRVEGGIEFITNGNIEVTTSDFTMKETDASTWLHADTSARTFQLNDATGTLKLLLSGSGTVQSANLGSAATPTFGIGTSYDDGIYSPADSILGFTLGGTEYFRSTTTDLYCNTAGGSWALHHGTGSAATVSYAFQSDPNTGRYWVSSDYMADVAGGTAHMLYNRGYNATAVINSGFAVGFTPTGSLTSGYLYSQPPTTAAAADATWVLASGSIYYLNRSTSSKRYKTDIDYDSSWLADVNLKPVRFWSVTDDTYQVGLIAEDVADVLPEAAAYNDDGQVENYDQRAVMAVLAAKVNRLEGAVL